MKRVLTDLEVAQAVGISLHAFKAYAGAQMRAAKDAGLKIAPGYCLSDVAKFALMREFIRQGVTADQAWLLASWSVRPTTNAKKESRS